MTRRADALRARIEQNAGVDLHSHTIFSDGAWTPEDLIRDAALAGIGVFALTDHDTVAGLAAAQAAADAKGIVFIPGVEVTVAVHGRPYHIHCYDVDFRDDRWTALARGKRGRMQRYYDEVFDQLSAKGYPVRRETVVDGSGYYVQHPVSTGLERMGYAPDFRAAGNLLRSLGVRYPWERLTISPEEYRELIPPDGGVCVVAHPAREERGVSARLDEADLRTLKSTIPLVGLEAFHPYHRPADVEAMRSLAEAHGLVVTAGSDAHGFNVNRPPKPSPANLIVGFLEIILERWETRDGNGI